ncbi:MAG: hypothetical protein IJM23_08575 [Lachnospiraceae bacterium]|nr:hypothetical protein [Lachnospiraceae bacterium]
MEKIKAIVKKHDLLFAALVCFVISRIMLFGMYAVLFHDVSPAGFIDELNRFDANHYHRLAEFSYRAAANDLTGEASWAFFPLYPFTVKAFAMLTSLSYEGAAFVLGGVFLIAACVLGGMYLEMTGAGKRAAYFYIAFLNLGLYSFYFSAFYTESMFLLLLTACFYFLEKKKYLWMGVCGVLMSLTRNIGVFFVLLIPVKLVMDYMENCHSLSLSAKGVSGEVSSSKTGSSKNASGNADFIGYLKTCFADPTLILGTFMIPLGLFSFMHYLYKLTGDALAFVHIQVAWGRVNGFFLKNLINALKQITGYDAYCAMWAVLGFYMVYMLIFKYKRYHEALFGLIVLILPMQSVMDSVPRYMLGGFVFAAVGMRLLSEAGRLTRIFVCLFILGFELVLINGWFLGAGVLI